jgi:transposase
LTATQRYKLIYPILSGEKTVREVHLSTRIATSTLYRYLQRYHQSGGELESLSDKSHAAHNHPNWFSEEDRDIVVNFKLQNPHFSSYQMADALTESNLLKISASTVRNVLTQRRIRTEFFLTNRRS